ncbi:hypothetical protein [Sulfitobacter dubius]|uniref:hypothetical protein n=1 Tax=Sulfitobacter dubius TaxID=218673 RepID=UPI0029432157|nr:hypothetical protein [Sulfitobacter dubius]WOI30055.1 hypothetical protein R1T39_04950 [Sulfitobacter dubius]
MMQMAPLKAEAMGRVRKPISIQRLLEWAFADECASIDFEDEGTLAPGYGQASNAYRIEQRGLLGCKIDGGGRSYPDHDADIVASAVAVLPEGCGGRRMAVQIAELARARAVPEAYVGAVTRCEPIGWRENQNGRRAVTETLGQVVDCSGRKVKRHDIRVCPVVFRPAADQIAAARRNYLQWWSALLELRFCLQIQNDMSRWNVTHELPARTPWKKVLAE